MKRLLPILSFLAVVLVLRAQFSPGFTNAKFSGSANSVLSGATFGIAGGGTFNGGGVFDFSGGTLTLSNNQVPWIAVNKTGALLSDFGGIVTGAAGGTGVANTSKTITLGGNLLTGGNVTFSGAFAFTGNLTAGTSVTFPTTGTLATLAGAESLTNKKLGSLTSNGVVQTNSSDGTLSVANVSLTAQVTGILPGANGGTNNAFFQINGPITTAKTYTVPDASTTLLTTNAAVTAAQGGTGQSSYTKGDLLVALNSTTLAKLGVGTNTYVVTANSSATNGVDWEAPTGATGLINSGGANRIAFYAAAGTTLSGADNTAQAIIGTASAAPVVGVLATYGTTQTNTAHAARVASASAGISGELYLEHSRGTIASPTSIQSGDYLGRINFGGYAGSQWQEFGTNIRAEAAENFTTSATGSRLVFATSAIGSISNVDKFSVENDGSLKAGTSLIAITNAAGNLLASDVKGTTTNDSASAGFIGEYVTSMVAIGSAVSLTNVTAANITSISLTAGDWDVSGIVNFTETTSTVTGREAGISSTTATLPTDGSEGYCGVQSTVTSETNSITLARKRLSLSGTTTIYLVGYAAFSAGTCGGFGALNARRVR